MIPFTLGGDPRPEYEFFSKKETLEEHKRISGGCSAEEWSKEQSFQYSNYEAVGDSSRLMDIWRQDLLMAHRIASLASYQRTRMKIFAETKRKEDSIC